MITIDDLLKRIRKHASRQATGISLKSSGYYVITVGPHKDRPLHRVLFEMNLGRRLLHDEIIHHKNHNKTDNRLSNLKLTNPSSHGRHHAIDRVKKGINFDISQIDNRGERHPLHKLSLSEVRSIRKNYKHNTRGWRQKVADRYNVTISCIKHIMAKHTWK